MAKHPPQKKSDRQPGVPLAGLLGAFDGSAPYDAILDRLSTLHPKVIDLSLDRVYWLLERLGNPHHDLPPVVHVAGTNGKGSVIAILRALLEASGQAVHVYTSPHLVRFNERVRLRGKLIADNMLEMLFEECEAANGETPITLFEITTVAALLAFARSPADVLILETGLGGRLDATNVVDAPALTAITPISLDHQQFLGDTIEKIAAEKAGILKPGVTCVVGAQPPNVQAVIRAKAELVGAPLLVQGQDWDVAGHPEGFVLHRGSRSDVYPRPVLAGDHQLANAGQALVCLDTMEAFQALPDGIARGLATASWPARLQHLTAGPLVDALPHSWELWLDGGHNPAAGEILAHHAKAVWCDRPLFLICGMLNSKDPGEFLAPLARVAESLRAVSIPGEENSLSADDMVAAASGKGLPSATASSVAAAISEFAGVTKDPARILICGSLYLAGTVLAENR